MTRRRGQREQETKKDIKGERERTIRRGGLWVHEVIQMIAADFYELDLRTHYSLYFES
jgi:hypothetical protein